MSAPLESRSPSAVEHLSPGAPALATEQAALMRRMRIQVFASTWASYFGFYFCRKAFYAVKPSLKDDLGLDPTMLGNLGFVYLLAYAIGEFNAAFVGSRTGARRLLLTGMAVSLGCNVVFGFANNQWTLMSFLFLNGLAQATGWSGNVGTMAQWFRREERGRVMGVWATCYQVGGAVATLFAAFMLEQLGWRWSFWGASLVLAGIWFLFYFLQRNRPEDVGLAPVESELPAASPASTKALGEAQTEAHKEADGFNRTLVTTLLMMGAFYFFVKFIRYALWSWTPTFLNLNFGLKPANAGYLSTLFDVFGFFGVLAAGFVSDRFFKSRRAGIALIMMVGLSLGTVVLWLFGASSLVMFGVAFSLVGFMLYGPDSLVSGAGAIDVSSRKYAIAAAGIINGMGSLGALVQEPVIGFLLTIRPNDLRPILIALMVSAGIATLMIALLVRRARRGLCNL